VKVKVIKPGTRLNGADVEEGKVIEIDDSLAHTWIKVGRAKEIGGVGRPPIEKAIKGDKTEKAIKKPEAIEDNE